jgi:hypothetical protein
MFFSDLSANETDNFVQVRARAMVHLLTNCESFFALDLYCKGGTAPWPEVWVTALDCQLDVLRVVIHASDYDYVLDAACHEQVSAADEAEVACSQKGSIIAISQPSFECLFGLFCPAPVTLGDARTGDPDLTDLVSVT